MKPFKIFILTLSLLLITASCNRNTGSKVLIEAKKEDPILKEYGDPTKFNKLPHAVLNFDEFESFSNLFQRCEKIVCNDSIPKIIIEKDGVLKRIYLVNKCPENSSRFPSKKDASLIYVSVRNDSIYKNRRYYPLDSLGQFIPKKFENSSKKDIENGNSSRLIIVLTNESCEQKNLLRKIDYLTDLYESITGKTDVNFILFDRRLIPPPPKPPICNINTD